MKLIDWNDFKEFHINGCHHFMQISIESFRRSEIDVKVVLWINPQFKSNSIKWICLNWIDYDLIDSVGWTWRDDGFDSWWRFSDALDTNWKRKKKEKKKGEFIIMGDDWRRETDHVTVRQWAPADALADKASAALTSTSIASAVSVASSWKGSI